MADEIRLTVQPRTVVGKQVKALRRSGWIPISLYGAQIEPRNLQAEDRVLRSVLNKAGSNRLIHLDLGDNQTHLVIAREIQRDPITGRLWHVDLNELSLTKKVDVSVPVVLKGTPPPVSRGEGLLIHGLEEVAIRVLPSELISEILVDVSVLESVNQAIFVSDLKLGDKIEILTAPEEMLAKVIAVREEIVAAEAPTATAEVEVVGKAKKEEEEEAETEGKREEKK